MGVKADAFIPETQMLSSTRKFAQLGNLYQSLVSLSSLFVLPLPYLGPSEADFLASLSSQ
jgi:hypothetical protein